MDMGLPSPANLLYRAFPPHLAATLLPPPTCLWECIFILTLFTPQQAQARFPQGAQGGQGYQAKDPKDREDRRGGYGTQGKAYLYSSSSCTLTEYTNPLQTEETAAAPVAEGEAAEPTAAVSRETSAAVADERVPAIAGGEPAAVVAEEPAKEPEHATVASESTPAIETPAETSETTGEAAAAPAGEVKFDEEKKDEKKEKDPKKQAKLARRLSAKIFGIVSPNKEKSKKEAELAAPAEVPPRSLVLIRPLLIRLLSVDRCRDQAR